ncbi:MAG TPA: hypothetical protein VF234_03325, partial [Limnochordia bacterium]
MQWLVTLHSIGGTLALVASLIGAVWATACYRRPSLPQRFFGLSYVVSLLFGLQLVVGVVMYALGHRPANPAMHLFYPLLVLLTLGADHMTRPGRPLRTALERSGSFREPVFFTY